MARTSPKVDLGAAHVSFLHIGILAGVGFLSRYAWRRSGARLLECRPGARPGASHVRCRGTRSNTRSSASGNRSAMRCVSIAPPTMRRRVCCFFRAEDDFKGAALAGGRFGAQCCHGGDCWMRARCCRQSKAVAAMCPGWDPSRVVSMRPLARRHAMVREIRALDRAGRRRGWRRSPRLCMRHRPQQPPNCGMERDGDKRCRGRWWAHPLASLPPPHENAHFALEHGQRPCIGTATLEVVHWRCSHLVQALGFHLY